MQELVSIFLIGVSLSMDTFSLSLSMGTLIKNKKFLTLFPFVVALFHFIMPLIGNKIGITIMNCFNVASNIVLGLILIILGVNLAIQFFKKEEINININLISIIFLAFSVSIDSFTIGLGISEITSKFIGKYASIIGILLLILLGVYHIL